MIIFANNITPRLRYTLDFIAGQVFSEQLAYTSDPEFFLKHQGPKINYSHSRLSEEEFHLVNHDLLSQEGITYQKVECFDWNGCTAFFQTSGDFPFDIFSCIFFLLSRFEEYLPHEKDSYGRYAHQNSLAFKAGFLNLPLIDIWLSHFKESLQKKFPLQSMISRSFEFTPTYDIDEAYAYSHKPLGKKIGGMLKDLASGKWSDIAERFRAWSDPQKDVYNSYSWLHEIHKKYRLKPFYFFLLAERRSRYDKNISPHKTAVRELVREHNERYPIGIHPSWQSGDDLDLLINEIKCLEQITGKRTERSRQHYIRMHLPQTYRTLLQCGIRSDYSMGYGSTNGFRASTSRPFYWYDLEKETQTDLLIFPFCFMDANSFFEQKLSAEEAYNELAEYAKRIKEVNGTMVTVWHNSFLGTHKRFKGWPDMYEKFIQEVTG